MENLQCQKCGATWIPRIPPEQIKCCPNCKNRRWRPLVHSGIVITKVTIQERGHDVQGN
jgi:hypothetical protein